MFSPFTDDTVVSSSDDSDEDSDDDIFRPLAGVQFGRRTGGAPF